MSDYELPRLVELAIIRKHLEEAVAEHPAAKPYLDAYDRDWNAMASSSRESRHTLDWMREALRLGTMSANWVRRWRWASKYMDFRLEKLLDDD